MSTCKQPLSAGKPRLNGRMMTADGPLLPHQLNALLGHFAGHNAHCLLSMFMTQQGAGLYNYALHIRRVG